MLKLLFSGIRLAAFIVIVLLLGNWVRWEGHSLAEHVLGGFTLVKQAAEEPIAATLSGHGPLAKVTHEAQHLKAEAKRKIASKAERTQKDLLSVTERMRMRTLIREVESN